MQIHNNLEARPIPDFRELDLESQSSDKGILSFIVWCLKNEFDFSVGNEYGDSIVKQAEDLLQEYKKELA